MIMNAFIGQSYWVIQTKVHFGITVGPGCFGNNWDLSILTVTLKDCYTEVKYH